MQKYSKEDIKGVFNRARQAWANQQARSNPLSVNMAPPSIQKMYEKEEQNLQQQAQDKGRYEEAIKKENAQMAPFAHARAWMRPQPMSPTSGKFSGMDRKADRQLSNFQGAKTPAYTPKSVSKAPANPNPQPTLKEASFQLDDVTKQQLRTKVNEYLAENAFLVKVARLNEPSIFRRKIAATVDASKPISYKVNLPSNAETSTQSYSKIDDDSSWSDNLFGLGTSLITMVTPLLARMFPSKPRKGFDFVDYSTIQGQRVNPNSMAMPYQPSQGYINPQHYGA